MELDVDGWFATCTSLDRNSGTPWDELLQSFNHHYGSNMALQEFQTILKGFLDCSGIYYNIIRSRVRGKRVTKVMGIILKEEGSENLTTKDKILGTGIFDSCEDSEYLQASSAELDLLDGQDLAMENESEKGYQVDFEIEDSAIESFEPKHSENGVIVVSDEDVEENEMQCNFEENKTVIKTSVICKNTLFDFSAFPGSFPANEQTTEDNNEILKLTSSDTVNEDPSEIVGSSLSIIENPNNENLFTSANFQTVIDSDDEKGSTYSSNPNSNRSDDKKIEGLIQNDSFSEANTSATESNKFGNK